jgi:Phage Terminase
MRAGPKGAVTADPLTLTGWPKGRAARRERFIGEYLVTPRGHGAGEPFKLRPFQREIIRGSFAPGIRSAVVSIPRANGKTMMAAALGMAEMFVGAASAEVLVVASDQRQANITLKCARRMVELKPLGSRCTQTGFACQRTMRRCCRYRLSLGLCMGMTRVCRLSTSCTSSPRRCGRRSGRLRVSGPSR